MSTSTVPVKFAIGSRKLLSVLRVLGTVAIGWADLSQAFRLPCLPWESLPMAALGDIQARFPRHLLGGFQAYQRDYIEMEGRSYQDYLAEFSSKTARP